MEYMFSIPMKLWFNCSNSIDRKSKELPTGP